MDDTGCWEYAGALNNTGYGRHKTVYEQYVGKVPDGMDLDHLCKNRSCVNPAHLEPVTRGENLRRAGAAGAVNAAKTACKRGHHDWVPHYSNPKHRMCRTCVNEYSKGYQKAKRKGQLFTY